MVIENQRKKSSNLSANAFFTARGRRIVNEMLNEQNREKLVARQLRSVQRSISVAKKELDSNKRQICERERSALWNLEHQQIELRAKLGLSTNGSLLKYNF